MVPIGLCQAPKRPRLELPLGLHRKNLADIKIMPIAFGWGCSCCRSRLQQVEQGRGKLFYFLLPWRWLCLWL